MTAENTLPKPGIRRRPHSSSALFGYVCAAFAILATCGWVVAACLMADRGFDITDEGFYVLSYRWWSTNLHSFNGAQYLYGPVFDLVGHNVAALRLFRLLSVLVVSVSFAVAFMNWLGDRNPHACSLRSRVAGAAAIVASAGMIYGWLPLSPGYDDVAALGVLGMAAVALSTSRRHQRGQHVPAWLPLLGGALCTVQMLSKWSSALGIAVYCVAIVLVLWGSGWKPLVRYGGLLLAGAAATAALIHLFVIPLDRAATEMWFVNKSAVDESGAPSGRALSYLTDLREVTESAIRMGYPLMLVAVATRFAGTRRLNLPWMVVIAAGFLLFWRQTLDTRGWQGGPANKTAYMVTILALVMVATIAGFQLRRPSRGDVGLLAMLSVLPLAQAFGTSNRIWMVASDAFPAWFAVVIWFLFTGARRPTAGLVTWCATASIVGLVPLIAASGLLAHPYRTTGYASDTAPVPGLASVRIDPTTAGQYTAVRRALRPYLRPAPKPIFAVDRLSGLVFILGGTAAGEPWNGSPLRSGAILRRACEQDEVGVDNPPILLFNRATTRNDIDALADCGLRYPRDFEKVTVTGGPPGLRIYVPR
jgi:hypothetical protein